MWNVKTKVIAVITEATGTISKSFRKNPEPTYRESMTSREYKNSHIGHYTHTHTPGSTYVKVQNIQPGK